MSKPEETPKQEASQRWPDKPDEFPELMTPVEAAMYVQLDLAGHTPKSAIRTLNYWREKDYLKTTKYSRHVWYLKDELEIFLKNKTES